MEVVFKDGNEDKSHHVCSLAYWMHSSSNENSQGQTRHGVHVLAFLQFYLPIALEFHSSVYQTLALDKGQGKFFL